MYSTYLSIWILIVQFLKYLRTIQHFHIVICMEVRRALVTLSSLLPFHNLELLPPPRLIKKIGFVSNPNTKNSFPIYRFVHTMLHNCQSSWWLRSLLSFFTSIIYCFIHIPFSKFGFFKSIICVLAIDNSINIYTYIYTNMHNHKLINCARRKFFFLSSTHLSFYSS